MSFPICLENSSAWLHVSCVIGLPCSFSRNSHHSSTRSHFPVSSTFHIPHAVSRGRDFWLRSLANPNENSYTSLNPTSFSSSFLSSGIFALIFAAVSAPILRRPEVNSSLVYLPIACAPILRDTTKITGSIASMPMSSQKRSMPSAPTISSSSSSARYLAYVASTASGDVDPLFANGAVKNISKPTSRSQRASLRILSATSSSASATAANRRTLSFWARFSLFILRRSLATTNPRASGDTPARRVFSDATGARSSWRRGHAREDF